MKVTYEHTIPATVDKVFEAYGQEEFYIARQKGMGALSVEVLKWETDANGEVRSEVRVTEPSKQPSFIRKSDVDMYVDHSFLDPAQRTLTWKVIPSQGADKFKLQGKVEFQADGDRTRVIYHIDIQVKIPIIGKKAEKYALAKTEEETAKQADFLKNWMRKQNY